jgi:zinc D-Ala-D-Ala carboxypeptidase
MRRYLLALPFLASCATADVSGSDLDVDPDELARHDSFGDPCARYPGGPLSGDDLLVLVNKREGMQLRSDWEPDDLVEIPESMMMPGRDGALRLDAFEAWMELAEAAREEAGLTLGVRSAYRSFETQCVTFDYKVAQHGIDHARVCCAEPGRSQHQLGTTLDITSRRLGWALSSSMGNQPEGLWLAENSLRFGFALSYPRGAEELTGYIYEPWHFRYIGRAAAIELSWSGLLLEEYLQACLDGDPRLWCPG